MWFSYLCYTETFKKFVVVFLITFHILQNMPKDLDFWYFVAIGGLFLPTRLLFLLLVTEIKLKVWLSI